MSYFYFLSRSGYKEAAVNNVALPTLSSDNIIVKRFHKDEALGGFPYSRTYTYDLNARLQILFNVHLHGENKPIIKLRFWPDMSEDKLQLAVDEEDGGRPFRQSVLVAGGLFEQRWGYEVAGTLYDSRVLYGFFEGIAGLDDGPCPEPSIPKEGDPGYQFWPAEVPGRGRAVAKYLFEAALASMRSHWLHKAADSIRGDERVSIAVSAKLLLRIGEENFPNFRRLENGTFEILSGDLKNDG